MTTPAIADSTILSNFALIKRPDLLKQAFSRIVIPESIQNEIKVGEQTGRLPICDWSWLETATLSPDEQKRSDKFARDLGRGESDCLAIAETRQLVCLTDDREARRIGARLGIELSGTLGALINLIDDGTLSEDSADRLLQQMRRAGYRSPVASISDLK